ncbi:MAG: hypothetical protein JSS29_15730 [Proteobacteria bacterium]|nr:hypothetical protein [Pseudomonadota bacterium]
MRTRTSALVLAGLAALPLAGCGGGDSSTPTSTPQATVNLVVSDTPSAGITVLSFQVEITSAVLEPGNVSLLPRPVTVDLAQLASDTGFLASTVIDSATFTSLQINYANPQVTILNNTGTTLTLSGQSCASGATCTFVPALNNASVTISSGVFPLTVSANSSTGLALDLSIPDLLQSDLSVTFASGKSVNLSLLGSGPVRIDDVLASVTSVSGSQVGLTTAFGDQLTVTLDGSTSFNYPTSVCAAGDAGCVAVGQLVTTDLSLAGDGALSVDTFGYVGAAGTPLVKGIVLDVGSSTAQVLLLHNLNADTLMPGEIATVTLPTASGAFVVGSSAYPSVAGASFAGAADVLRGQELVLAVGSDLSTAGSPSFTSPALYLEDSQILGGVESVDTADEQLIIDGLTGLFSATPPVLQTLTVQAGSSTTLVGFSALSDLAAGKLLVSKGPLFNVPGTGTPVQAALQLRTRASN